MASAWYQEGLHGLMNKEIDLDTDTIRVRAVADDDYTFSQAHTSMSSVTKYTSSTDYTLTSVDISTTKGTMDAADATPAYSSLAQDGVKSIDALVVFHFVTDDAGSTPLIYIDLTTPVDPNGGDINITWNGSGIASL
jgi:hypothetical protein